jgi:hypothetical protein
MLYVEPNVFAALGRDFPARANFICVPGSITLGREQGEPGADFTRLGCKVSHRRVKGHHTRTKIHVHVHLDFISSPLLLLLRAAI